MVTTRPDERPNPQAAENLWGSGWFAGSSLPRLLPAPIVTAK
jgi:hypothetical protein